MNKIYYLILVSLCCFTTACGDFDEINTDPNNPATVTPNLLLPSVQGAFGYGLGGDLARHAGDIMQHFTGAARQWAVIHNYGFTEVDMDNVWRFQLYAGSLKDLQNIIQQTDGTSPHYSGVAKIYTALVLGVMTDLWGDLPYSDAFQGAANFQSAFDTQETLYATIHGLLDAGIADLNQETSTTAPGSEDLTYGGSLNQWKQLANGLHARMYIHVSHKNGDAAQQALAALANGALTSNGDNAMQSFGEASTAANPMQQFNDQRGDIVYNGFMADLMTNLSDPRFEAYFADGAGDMGALYGSATSAVPLFTYAEQKFIEAEALSRTGADPHDAFVAGITASMQQVGIVDAAIAAYIGTVDNGAGNVTLEDIMTQKYIALYTQVESWTDWRRTGIPNIQPVTGDQIPRRLPYPESERLYNVNTPSDLSKFSRVWWDQ